MAAAVRLIFGSPLGLPSAADVQLLLDELGIGASGVHPAARQVWGVARYEATEIGDAGGAGRLAIAVYGRDAADARLFTKAGRFVLYRDSGPSLTITRLQQVEHEAYLTLRAGQAGVAVPEVAEAGTAGPAKDALLVSRLPGTPLADAQAADVSDAMLEVPKLAEPHRVSWPNLIMMAGLLIGGWALAGVLLNVSKSFDTVIGASWLWVIMAFVLAELAYLALGLQNVGSVAGPLPYGRAVAVEVANSFSALAGGTPAVLATRVRFFQQQGYDATVALSSGAIMTTASWIAIIVLFACSLPFAWGSIHLKTTPQAGFDPKLIWIALAVIVAVAVLAGLALTVPRLRRLAAAGARQVRPRVRQVWANLRQVAVSPRKLVLLASGSFAQPLLVAMALSVSLRAFGVHRWLPILVVVITLAGFIGGISPSPGGMGVVEAGMILGLTATGVSEANATAAVFIQRLFTSYLPPIWGWAVLVWMRKKEYL